MARKPGGRPSIDAFFSRAARWSSQQAGRAYTFAIACALLLVWAVLGPVFHFSDGWQLVVNTGTTIVTFLMVFLIQNAQNRDTAAIQLKLDELIRANKDARNKLLSLEDLSEKELKQLKDRFEAIARSAAGEVGAVLTDSLPDSLREMPESTAGTENEARRNR